MKQNQLKRNQMKILLKKNLAININVGYVKKNITNENFGGYSEDGTMICYRCLNKYGKDKPKEEPVYNEYGYDQYGNYDPNKDLNNDREWNDEDYERWDDIYGDKEEDYDDYSEEPIQEADDVEEYEEEKDYNEVDTIDDTDEDINY